MRCFLQFLDACSPVDHKGERRRCADRTKTWAIRQKSHCCRQFLMDFARDCEDTEQLHFYIHFRINLVGIIAKTVLIKIYTFKYFNRYSLLFSQILFYFSFIYTDRSAPAFHQYHSAYPFFRFPIVSTPLPPPAAPGTHPASKPRGPSPPASSLPCGCFPVIHNVPYALPGTSAASAPDPPPRSPGRICPR